MKVMNNERLCEEMLTHFPHLTVGDRRPYQTMGRYLASHRVVVSVGDGKNLYLARSKAGNRPTTMNEVLFLCEKWAKESLASAAPGYPYMAAEEDVSEILLIKEVWKKYATPVAKAPRAKAEQMLPPSTDIDAGLALLASVPQSHDWDFDADDDVAVQI